MKALDTLNMLNDLCASQRGMFTAAQAMELGVGRMDLSRLASHGHVEQVARGVYRAAGAPSFREEDVYAAWLATEPRIPAYDRPLDGTGFTASLNTAAWLHGLGDLRASPMTFSHPARRQTRNANLKFDRRTIPPMDIMPVAGVPTTTPGRTVLDLIDYGWDLTLVSSVLKDSVDRGLCRGIANEIDRRAVRCGYQDGFALYDYLRGL